MRAGFSRLPAREAFERSGGVELIGPPEDTHLDADAPVGQLLLDAPNRVGRVRILRAGLHPALAERLGKGK